MHNTRRTDAIQPECERARRDSPFTRGGSTGMKGYAAASAGRCDTRRIAKDCNSPSQTFAGAPPG